MYNTHFTHAFIIRPEVARSATPQWLYPISGRFHDAKAESIAVTIHPSWIHTVSQKYVC